MLYDKRSYRTCVRHLCVCVGTHRCSMMVLQVDLLAVLGSTGVPNKVATRNELNPEWTGPV